MDLTAGGYFNTGLARHPLNWMIVFTVATIWLLLFHVLMTAWQAMVGAAPSSAAPDAIASATPVPNVAATFSQTSVLADVGVPGGLGTIAGGGVQIWTDGLEGRYAEDGWIGS